MEKQMKILIDAQSLQTKNSGNEKYKKLLMFIDEIINYKGDDIYILINKDIDNNSNSTENLSIKNINKRHIISFYTDQSLKNTFGFKNYYRDGKIIYQAVVERFAPDVLIVCYICDKEKNPIVIPSNLSPNILKICIINDFPLYKKTNIEIYNDKSRLLLREQIDSIRHFDVLLTNSEYQANLANKIFPNIPCCIIEKENEEILLSESQSKQNNNASITNHNLRSVAKNKIANIIYPFFIKKYKTPKLLSTSEIIDNACFHLGKSKHSYKNKINLVRCLYKTIYDQDIYYDCGPWCRTINSLPEKLTWRIEGPFDSSYSLAIVNREFAMALKKLGHNILLISSDGFHDIEPDNNFLINHIEINDMYLKAKEQKVQEIDIISRNMYPPRVHDMEDSSVNIIHSYGWEETEFPREWVEAFNEKLNAIFVVSPFVKKVLQDNGVIVPIASVGMGLDHWKNIKSNHYKISAKKFKILHVSTCIPRKAADVILQSYYKYFTNKDDVSLIIKTFKHTSDIANLIKELNTINKNPPHIILIDEDLSDSSLKSLMEQCDLFVAPSRGEGFGLPIAEAMLSGVPVITSEWSGQMSFCNNNNSWLVKYTIEKSKSHFNLEDSLWAEPDVDDLGILMKKLQSMPNDIKNVKIQNAYNLLNSDDFSWLSVGERSLKALKSIESLNIDQPIRLGWVSTWDIKCGIAEYSKHIIDNLPIKPFIFSSYTDQCSKDDYNIIRCWDIGGNTNCLEQEIFKHKINVIVIQWNYAFFNTKSLNELLINLKSHKIIVCIFLHATLDYTDNARIIDFKDGLQSADRIFVHNIDDINRLHDIGIIHNVTLIRHGIIDYKSNNSNPINHLIATYGFFFKHKGLIETIKAFSILKKKYSDLKLIMLNAEYPIPESKICISEARELIDSLNLNNDIELNTNFLTDEESFIRLRNAQLILYPYQYTSESASGAVRAGLSVGRPVVTTPLSIFSDVHDIVFQFAGTSISDIVNGISKLLELIDRNDKIIIDKQIMADKWRELHSYKNITSRLYKLLIALYQDSLINF